MHDAGKAGERRLSDEELWSWVDRSAPELDDYLARHADEAVRVAEMRRVLDGLGAEGDTELPTQIGAFRILGVLGRGGMGVVYDAEQDSPRRKVALKVLPPEFARDPRRRLLFQREGDAQALLTHPGIAAIYEVGAAAEPYIAMERVAGEPLQSYVQGHSLDRHALLTLFRSICEAVGHAHEHGVVHRDLKPSNVLVQEDGQPKVLDFGLARIVESEAALVTRTGTISGTLPYMSPEQVRGEGEGVGSAADVFSLGVILYELVTGKLPHDVASCALPEAARRICEVLPVRAGKALHGDLKAVVWKALEKEPRRRYASAREMGGDLGRLLDGRPTIASRPSIARRAWHFSKRHWAGTLLTTSLLAFFVALALPSQIRFPLVGRWPFGEGAPFEELRWRGRVPEVRHEGEWYELVKIEDLHAAHLVGLAQQFSNSDDWRKRFSEDLLQLLNRSGVWRVSKVDMTLRDLGTRELLVVEDAPLDEERRRAIRKHRIALPWEWGDLSDAAPRIVLEGREWELVSVDGVEFDGLWRQIRSSVEQTIGFQPDPRRRGARYVYDGLCDWLGYSPGDGLELGLVDAETDHFETRTVHWRLAP